MEIFDDKYDQLLAFVESGAKADLPEELIKYLSVLELIRSMHFKFENRQTIINFLQKPPYQLSQYLASKYYSDAINFFYIDVKITKQALRNMYAEKLDRAADLVLKTATNSKDLDIYKNIIYAIRDLRELNIPEKEDIPEEFYKKPYKLYVLDPKLIGRQRPNRNELARHIDSLEIPEYDKQRLKRDALIEDAVFLTDEEDENQ